MIISLQAQPISAELAAKLLGNRVAVSPIVTVEPRRRKFHKPITLTIPVPQAANKGMINQYSGDAPTLRLLCSITGKPSNAGGYTNSALPCSVYQTCYPNLYLYSYLQMTVTFSGTMCYSLLPSECKTWLQRERCRNKT
jgi:hypothetical protein